MSEQLFREALENTRLAMRGELGIGATDEALLWAEQRIAELETKIAKGCVHNDLVYLEEVIKRRNERIAVLEEAWSRSIAHCVKLEEFLHELYHLDKRVLDETEYDKYRLACDFGEVMKRYMEFRTKTKEPTK